ncbi:MAG TPA: amidohydrolase family protein [Anaerolineaceae bacterium]|nr:amidohydrolase family protein [Anaerolineaceae bacterium]HPN49978.1 amidohydrolase family protein [Anaerolineaceae bacterium]
MIKLPGLIDPHVHLREPGDTHKEDWRTGTRAALAGGFTIVLAMPNTRPPVTDAETLSLALKAAGEGACCDYAQFIGAGAENAAAAGQLSRQAAGLKLYLDQTYGPLRLDALADWQAHFAAWPKHLPISVHAEGRSLAAAILFAGWFDRPLHLCHISTRDDILLVRQAKEHGLKVTCEVTPHHLFLDSASLDHLGAGMASVKPPLASPADVQALWDNLDVIDCFATDHAPHTLAEKQSPTPPPGFPGLETALPLLLTAVREGRLTLDDIILRCYTNPQRIYRLPVQTSTWIEVDPDARWEITPDHLQTRCAWTPFAGRQVFGRVRRVVLRRQVVFEDGVVLAPTGSGRNLRLESRRKFLPNGQI